MGRRGLNQESIRRAITYLPTDGGSHSGVTMAGRWGVSRCTDTADVLAHPVAWRLTGQSKGCPAGCFPVSTLHVARDDVIPTAIQPRVRSRGTMKRSA